MDNDVKGWPDELIPPIIAGCGFVVWNTDRRYRQRIAALCWKGWKLEAARLSELPRTRETTLAINDGIAFALANASKCRKLSL